MWSELTVDVFFQGGTTNEDENAAKTGAPRCCTDLPSWLQQASSAGTGLKQSILDVCIHHLAIHNHLPIWRPAKRRHGPKALANATKSLS